MPRRTRLLLPRRLPSVLAALALALAMAPGGRLSAQETPTGHPPATAVPQEPRGDGEAPAGGPPATKPSRRGIPVDDPVVHTHCARCHALDERQQMTRISYLRKSPEGWAESVKRMVRLHGVQLSPEDAKQVVKSLANSHGLARSEAERGLYESERRVHWSEEQHDQDFRRACAQCHPLGRVLLQQRDEEEWQLLRATHVAMFPLARGQMGGGPPDDEMRRFGGGGDGPPGGMPGGGGRGARGGRGQGGDAGAAPAGGSDGPGSQLGVGDRVLQKLAKDQPLFTKAWDAWQKNRREVPLAGTWTVTGHETGRGDLFGTATVTRTGPDEYDVHWRLTATDGSTIERRGKGLLYAGYSWRGRSEEPTTPPTSWREVLLLDERWQTLRGRLFTGHYDEIGVDVQLHRDQGQPRVLAVDHGAIPVPTTGHVIDAYGEAFPANVGPADVFVGEGIAVQKVERLSDRHLRVVVDAAPGTPLGARMLAVGADPFGAALQLYDTVDYVRIRPLQGLSRIGGERTDGARHPRQIERFEAYAVHRGADEKPYTEDDVDLFQVRPQWGLAEFRVRENDDDVQYVGRIDPATGVFTPNIDGPNPARKWSANNIGDVFVTAAVELEVPVRPAPPPKPPAAEGPPGKPAEPTTGAAKPPAETSAPATAAAAPAREKKQFFARGHLLVTVPLYVRWMALDWEER